MRPWSRPTARRQAEVERFHRENLGSYHAEMASRPAEGALHAADRPDRAERRAARDRARDLGALAGPPDARRAARLHDLPDAALQPGPRDEPAGQPDPRRLGRRGADHRDARPAAVGDRVLARGQTRPGAGQARTRARQLPLSRDRAKRGLGRLARGRARRGAGAGRAERRGQVDAGEAAAPLLRPALRPDPAGRRGPSRAHPGRRCETTSRCCCRRPSSSTGRSTRTSRTAGATRRATQVEAAAVAADAHDFISALPDGYETEIGQKGRRLSGGQRQRIAIARAMVRDAPVLILDEPTTGVDAESGSRIMGPLRRLMGGRTTIVISHNLVTVRDADRIAVLEERADHGSSAHTRSCCNDGGTYERLYRLHHVGTEDSAPPAMAARRWSSLDELVEWLGQRAAARRAIASRPATR